MQCLAIFGQFMLANVISVVCKLSRKMADSEQRGSCNTATSKEIMVKQEKREPTLTNGGKGSGDDADSLEELPLDIGEHYLVRRSDDSWRA